MTSSAFPGGPGSAPPAGRLATQAQLDALCRNGSELMHEAIDSGDAAIAAAEARRINDARRGLVDLMKDWTASTIAWVRDTHGDGAVAAVLDADLWLELGLRNSLSLDETVLARSVFAGESDVAERIGALAGAGDRGGAKALWDGVEEATRKLHDYRIDWLTAALTHVHRAYGDDGVYGAMLRAGQSEWWLGRMRGDLARLDQPLARATDWGFFLGVGNWGTISMTEQDDCFVIHHQVCGSCGRQELRSRHEPPTSFARIRESRLDLNFGIPDYTVYRTHLPVWHFVVPIAEVGHPWPAIRCTGVPGRCWFTIYKDPHDTPEWYYEQVGLTKPPRPLRSENA